MVYKNYFSVFMPFIVYSALGAGTPTEDKSFKFSVEDEAPLRPRALSLDSFKQTSSTDRPDNLDSFGSLRNIEDILKTGSSGFFDDPHERQSFSLPSSPIKRSYPEAEQEDDGLPPINKRYSLSAPAAPKSFRRKASTTLQANIAPTHYPGYFEEASRHQFSRLQKKYERQIEETAHQINDTMRIHDQEDARAPLVIGTFNGGGVKGVLQASIQRSICEDLGINLVKLYDVTGGTSVGSILAAASASHQFSADDCVDILKENAPSIFAKRWYRSLFSLGGLAAPIYSRNALDTLLQESFGDIKLSETAIPYSAVSVLQYKGPEGLWGQAEPHIFKSSEARDNPLLDTELYNVLACSSAAPSYFAPYQFEFRESDVQAMDGGLIANSPDLETILHAHDVYGSFEENDVVLLYRTGYQQAQASQRPGFISRSLQWMNPLRHGGIYEHGGSVFHSFMNGQSQRSQANALQVMNRLGIHSDNVFELNGELSDLDMARTDEGFLEEMEESGQDAFENLKRDTPSFLDKIRLIAEGRD